MPTPTQGDSLDCPIQSHTMLAPGQFLTTFTLKPSHLRSPGARDPQTRGVPLAQVERARRRAIRAYVSETTAKLYRETPEGTAQEECPVCSCVQEM